MLVLAFAGDPLVQVGGVGVAAPGHRDVEQGAAGAFAEDGMGDLGGDALGGVHGNRIPVGDVPTQVVAGEGGAGTVIESAGGDPGVVGVNGEDLPAFPLRTGSSARWCTSRGL